MGRVTHLHREESDPERMINFEIMALYTDLSTHFNVPMPDWKILPEMWGSVAGCVLCEPEPIILFFQKPELKTAMHEFMHYLVYCVKNGIAEAEKRELSEDQIKKLRKLLEDLKNRKSSRIWKRIRHVKRKWRKP